MQESMKSWKFSLAFIDLYSHEECLWRTESKDYFNRQKFSRIWPSALTEATNVICTLRINLKLFYIMKPQLEFGDFGSKDSGLCNLIIHNCPFNIDKVEAENTQRT